MTSVTQSPLEPAAAEPARRGLRLLSLDGGGVRGISELYILEKLMERLKADENINFKGQDLLPCEVFDMISGTSTGGLIAIMLGRLRMSIKECQKAYGDFAEFVFNDPKRGFGFQEGRYKATNLKKAIVDIVNKHDKENDNMQDHSQNECKVFVCAMPEAEMRHPRRIRTYEINGINENCKIWEAARASTAAPTYFKAAEIPSQHGGAERFVDGGMGCNNPVLELRDEAKQVYGGRKIDCIISIGTGTKPAEGLARPSPFQNRFPLHVVPVLLDHANDSEMFHEIMYRDFQDRPKTYFRFSVPGIGVIDLAAWKLIPTIHSRTMAYLDSPEIDNSVSTAVETLSASMSGLLLSQSPQGAGVGSSISRHNTFDTHQEQGRDSAGQSGPTRASAENYDIWRQEASLRPNVTEGPRSGIAMKDDTERQQIFLQALQVNFESVHDTKDKKIGRFKGTCEWFPKREAFNSWKTNRGDQVLLVTAPPGQGKSVLAKYLVDEYADLRDPEGQNINLEYFCHGSPNPSTALTIIRYFLYQLLDTRRYLFKHVFQLYPTLNFGALEYQFETLWKIFVAILRNRGNGEVHCIIDGVDECDPKSQELLLHAIEREFTQLSDSEHLSPPFVRILLTSRPTALATRLGRLSSLYEIQNTDLNPDISIYIESEVQRMMRARILPEHLKSVVSQFLSGGAKGMFLWVALNLEKLNQHRGGLSVLSMQHKLRELPQSVEAIYDAAVRKITADKIKQDLAQKIFGILFNSYDALEIDAFAIACCDWPGSCILHSELNLRIDFQFEDSSKDTCDSLIRFVNGTIQFCHPTAAQFLLEDKSSFSFDDDECHLQLARTCIRYLLLMDVEIPKVEEDGTIELDRNRFPFLPYALQNWFRHLEKSPTFTTKYPEMLRQFILTEHEKFRKILHTFPYFQEAFPRDNNDCNALAVHALAYFGLVNILRNIHFSSPELQGDFAYKESSSFLLELKTSVNVRSSIGSTPLFAAVYSGSIEAVQTLLNLGASTEVLDDDNSTVFHIISGQTRDEYVAIAKLLIPLAHNLEIRNSDGATPLLLATSKEIAEILLRNGADVNCNDATNELTPLGLAAQGGNEDFVRLLLGHEANVNYKSPRSWTALHDAATQPNSNIIGILLNQGAEIQTEMDFGWNALHVAASNGHSESVKQLLSRVRVDCQTSDGRTSLYIAAAAGHESVVEALLAAHSDMEIADDGGITPLHAAASEGKDNAAKVLITAGAQVNSVTASYHTPLTEACRRNHLSMVKLLLENGANKYYTNESEIPMLQLAIYGGNLEIAKYLIDNNVNLESTLQSNYTPLYVAAWQDHTSISTLLLDKRANPHCCGEDGVTALHMFAEHGREELIIRLLDMGLNANIESENKWTPLHYAADKGHLKIAKTLVARGASTGARTSYGSTPLILASKNGHAEFADWLLNEQMVDPNESDNKKWSALHVAVSSGSLSIVNMLLLAGIPPNLRTDRGIRPLYEAARSGNMLIVNRLLEADPDERSYSTERWTPLSIAAWEGHLDVVDTLLKAGADINCESKYANLAYHNALEKGHLEVTKLLLTYINDPLQPDFQGNPSLLNAAIGGRSEILEILLTSSTDVNVHSLSGYSPLHAAAERGHGSAVKQLLKHGAEIDIENRRGETPLMLASFRGHSEAIGLLLEAGSDPNKLSYVHNTALNCAAWHYWDITMKVLLDHNADPFIRDCYGRSTLDLAQMYEPTSKLMSPWQAIHGLSKDDDREKRLRSTLSQISKRNIASAEERRTDLSILSHTLMFLGNEVDALIGFESRIGATSKELQGATNLKNIKHNITCDLCSERPVYGSAFICKFCVDTDLCASCMDKYKEGTSIRGCSGHDFLEMPRPSWFKLAPGTVNEQGETLEQWLQRIYDTYKDETLEVDEMTSASVPEAPVLNVAVE